MSLIFRVLFFFVMVAVGPLGLATGLMVSQAKCCADELDWIQVSGDGKGFSLVDSGESFIPWGFNYDHEGDGRLIEDYWDDEWDKVESAFGEMKELGANVVRIHLQIGKFMESPAKPNEGSLKQLARLVTLAEQTDLYLDLTGLGCYHKQDVPQWYDELSEQDRWAAQAVFWEAVAKRCAHSPAVFCYDLMNEPVVPGGNSARTDWLGPGFGDKHFVQFIALDRQGRDRTEVAQAWIGKLVSAIRQHDDRHMITVGLVPWSLDRPGMTSGFVPEKIAADLDFIAMHLYPEKGKLDEAIETLKGFAAAGKPVVIEEMFPLKCGAEELGQFIDQSRPYATGWIGFYWGKTPAEIRPAATIPAALTLTWLELFQSKRESILGSPQLAFLSNGVTAHRGNSGELPENTLAAFRSGINVGADWIELDILRTRDRQLVVIHDPATERVGGADRVVAESSYAELAEIDIAADFRKRTGKTLVECPPAKMPLLKDVLAMVKTQGRTRVSIQPKMNCVADAVSLIQSMNAERWVGFNDGNLEYMAEVKRLVPEVPVFWDRGPKTDIDSDIKIAKQHRFESLVLRQDGITPEKVQKIRAAGIEVGAWTVNDPATMQRLLRMGVQRIYTDHPGLLLSLKTAP